MPPPSIKERQRKAEELKRSIEERERKRLETFDKRYKQLLSFLKWCQTQKDSQGRTLLERARETLETGSYKKYVTRVNFDTRTFKCTCPDHYYRGRVCKHMVAKALIDNLDVVFEKSPEWKEFFQEKYRIHPYREPDVGRLDDRGR